MVWDTTTGPRAAGAGKGPRRTDRCAQRSSGLAQPLPSQGTGHSAVAHCCSPPISPDGPAVQPLCVWARLPSGSWGRTKIRVGTGCSLNETPCPASLGTLHCSSRPTIRLDLSGACRAQLEGSAASPLSGCCSPVSAEGRCPAPPGAEPSRHSAPGAQQDLQPALTVPAAMTLMAAAVVAVAVANDGLAHGVAPGGCRLSAMIRGTQPRPARRQRK